MTLVPVEREFKKEYDRQRYAANRKVVQKQQAEYRAVNAVAVRERGRKSSKRYYAANAQLIKERNKQYRIANVEREKKRHKKYLVDNAERASESRKRTYRKHVDRIKVYRDAHAARQAEYSKQWREINAATVRDAKKSYHKANPDKHAANGRKRRALMKGAVGHHTILDVKQLWLRQGKKCAVKECRHPISDIRGHSAMYHVDHIIPLKPKGSEAKGTNWPDNLQILCGFHNSQKHNKHPYDWAQEQGRLF